MFAQTIFSQSFLKDNAILKDLLRLAFDKFAKPMRVLAEICQCAMEPHQHESARQGWKKRNCAVDRASKHRSEDKTQDGVECRSFERNRLSLSLTIIKATTNTISPRRMTCIKFKFRAAVCNPKTEFRISSNEFIFKICVQIKQCASACIGSLRPIGLLL